jgi:SEC-C motif-containing protein
MRSRYSAYVLLLEEYLLNTWHSTTRPTNLKLAHEAFTHPRKWLGLKVLHAEQLSLNTGQVEFIAKYKVNGKAHKIHEISDFVCENNQWFYVDGKFPNEPNTDK